MESEAPDTSEWPDYVEVKVENEEEPLFPGEADIVKEDPFCDVTSPTGNGDLSCSQVMVKKELLDDIEPTDGGSLVWTFQPVKTELADDEAETPPWGASIGNDDGDPKFRKNFELKDRTVQAVKRRLADGHQKFPEFRNQFSTFVQAEVKISVDKTQLALARKNVKISQCYYCGYKFSRKCHLASHIRTHRVEINNTVKKHFGCALCEYTCAQHGNLERHMRKHTGEKPFACKLCEYTCARSCNLVRHMRKHSGEKPFACEFCDYKCAHSYNLKMHMNTHTGEKPFACEICEYTCARFANLRRHMRCHTGEKPFACEHCDYTCAEGLQLKRHTMSNHSREKPFACNVCKYTTAVRSSLNRHMIIHTREKPFS